MNKEAFTKSIKLFASCPAPFGFGGYLNMQSRSYARVKLDFAVWPFE